MSAQHDIARLERDIRTLQKAVQALARDDVYDQLLELIHRPGWTTPAEFLLVDGAVNSMTAQLRELTALRDTVVVAARQIAVGERVGVGG